MSTSPIKSRRIKEKTRADVSTCDCGGILTPDGGFRLSDLIRNNSRLASQTTAAIDAKFTHNAADELPSCRRRRWFPFAVIKEEEEEEKEEEAREKKANPAVMFFPSRVNLQLRGGFMKLYRRLEAAGGSVPTPHERGVCYSHYKLLGI